MFQNVTVFSNPCSLLRESTGRSLLRPAKVVADYKLTLNKILLSFSLHAYCDHEQISLFSQVYEAGLWWLEGFIMRIWRASIGIIETIPTLSFLRAEQTESNIGTLLRDLTASAFNWWKPPGALLSTDTEPLLINKDHVFPANSLLFSMMEDGTLKLSKILDGSKLTCFISLECRLRAAHLWSEKAARIISTS